MGNGCPPSNVFGRQLMPSAPTSVASMPTSSARIYKGAIFDLDGVLVDTAKLHFQAWLRLAKKLEIPFTEADNERLKGVSRDESLNILLSLGNVSLPASDRVALANQKNRWYVDLIETLTSSDLLPGAQHCLTELQQRGIPIALASASRNAMAVLKRLGIAHHFRVVLDGNSVTKAKPDPEIFLRAAAAIATEREDCVAFEDAPAGIRAAHAGSMYAVGVGKPDDLPEADVVIPDLSRCPFDALFASRL